MPERAPIQDVNIAFGDDVSRMLYEASTKTHENRPGLLVEFHESFSGFRAIPGSVLNDVGNLYFNLGFDGVGTKIEVSERLDDHSVVAHDLFAMVCDDAVVRGAEAVALGSILDVSNFGDPDDPESKRHAREAVRQLCVGYVAAAKEAGVVVVNGETAELGDRVGGYDGLEHNFNYNWGAAVLWIAHKKRILTGHQIRPGDALVGLAEHGFRSNGITGVRKTLLEYHGKQWHDEVVSELGNLSLGRLVQEPSTIYSRFVTELTGGFDIDKEPKAKVTGVAHITGGGQPSKLGRMLEPSGLGLEINNPIEPPEIMKYVQRLRGLSDTDAYGSWHMGPGMVIATPDLGKVLVEAHMQGIEARHVGYVTDEPGIRIQNRGVQQEEEWLRF